MLIKSIHLPRTKRINNKFVYYNSLISGKLKKVAKLDGDKVIQEKFYTKKHEETFDYIIINGKRKLSNYTKDKKIYIQRDGDTTPWIISTLKKTFGIDGKIQSVTNAEFSSPLYQMGPCKKGKIDLYQNGKKVFSQDISNQYP